MTEDIKNLGTLKELATLKKENPDHYNETIAGMKGVMKDLTEEVQKAPETKGDLSREEAEKHMEEKKKELEEATETPKPEETPD